VTFREADDSSDLDIVPTKNHYQIHHRWLSYQQVHSQRQTCPLFQSRRSNPENPPVLDERTCDCAVERLLSLLLLEFAGLRVTEQRQIAQTAQDLLKTMPRNVVVSASEKGDSIEMQFRIGWDYFGEFEFLVLAENAREEEYLYFESREDDTEGEETIEEDNEHPSSQGSGIASPEKPTSENSPQSTFPSEIVHRGKTRSGATSHTFNISDTPLKPGTSYTLLIRPFQHQSFFSLPVKFTAPVPSPTNLICTRNASSLIVTWTSPLESATFRVTCADNDDWIHISPPIRQREYVVTHVVDGVIRVGVVVESESGIKSAEAKVVVPPPDDENTTGSEEEMETAGSMGEDDVVSSSAEEDLSCDEDSNFDDEGTKYYPEEELAGSPGEDEDDEMIYAGCGHVDPGAFRHRSPGLATSRDSSTLASDDEGFNHYTTVQVDAEAESWGKFHCRGAYRLGLDKGPLSSIVYLHRIADLACHHQTVSYTTFHLLNRDENLAVLLFKDWAQCGKESDAEETQWDLHNTRIFATFDIECPVLNAMTEPLHDSHYRESKHSKIKVEWAASRVSEPFEPQLRYLNDVGNLSIGSERLLAAAPWIVHEYNCGLGENTAALLGEGFSVSVGVESNEIAGKSWQVHIIHSLFFIFLSFLLTGCIEDQRKGNAVHGIPFRVSISIPKPAWKGVEASEYGRSLLSRYGRPTFGPNSGLMVGSNEARLDGNNDCGVYACTCGQDKSRSCRVFRQALQIAKVVKPLVITVNVQTFPTAPFNAPHAECWDNCLRESIALGYEFRGSTVEPSEFGYQRRQSQFRIIFSKVGLPCSLGTIPLPSLSPPHPPPNLRY